MTRSALLVVPALASVTIALSAISHPAAADWRIEPVLLQPNGYACQQVAACSDGGDGVIVAWEDRRSGYGGPLRTSHVRAIGELDPGWANASIVCDVDFNRSQLRAFPDGAGGALLTWMQGAALHFLRVPAGGVAASGSRVLVTVAWTSRPPRVISDGVGGLYVGWLTRHPSAYHVLRVGADGLPSPGWTASGKVFTVQFDPSGNPANTFTGSLGLAPDGGVWVVYAGYGVDPDGMIQPGAVRLARIAPTGTAVAGWGRTIAAFPAETMPCEASFGTQGWEYPAMDLVDAASDGAGGVYVLHAQGIAGDPATAPGLVTFVPRLHRLNATKQVADGWPEDGRPIPGAADEGRFWDYGAEASYRVWSVADGEVAIGLGHSGGTAGPYFVTTGVRPDGSCGTGFGGGKLTGIEFAGGAGAAAYVASFYPEGPRGPCDWTGYASCSGTNGESFGRVAGEGQFAHYSDVGVAVLPDGGAVFAWGEAGTTNGLFAVRIGKAAPTDVPGGSPTSAPRLALRFVPGSGLRASAEFVGAGEARLLVADVAGRAVARQSFEATEVAREWTVPGTASLAPGLYFAHVERGAEVLTARVVVTR